MAFRLLDATEFLTLAPILGSLQGGLPIPAWGRFSCKSRFLHAELGFGKTFVDPAFQLIET
jgi:hypothetical protein